MLNGVKHLNASTLREQISHCVRNDRGKKRFLRTSEMTEEKKRFLRSFEMTGGKGSGKQFSDSLVGESNDDIGKCVNEIMTNEIMK